MIHRPDAIQAMFAERCRLFGDLFEARRIDELVSVFYAPDAILEGQGLPPQQGHAAIRRIYEESRASCDSIRIFLDPLTVVGDLAYGCITNTNRDVAGGIQTHRGMMVWRRFDETWAVVHDFFFLNDTQALPRDWSGEREVLQILP